MNKEEFQRQILEGIPQDTLPPKKEPNPSIDHSPKRKVPLSESEINLAIRNALRYFPLHFHDQLSQEFAQELANYGHIYMYRYMPEYDIYARPIDWYPGKTLESKAIMQMIMNNLDKQVAQFPEELITYGSNGSVFQNWAQYRLTLKYLAELTYEETLLIYSGHPLGIFPSSKNAPRVVISNGIVVPKYCTWEDWERGYALGVTQYGQMTAGSYMYIGPQGIVHGTTITILNAGRLNKIWSPEKGLAGKVFVSSGLGGMSGAQAKAAKITGAIGIIAEINPIPLKKRYSQGWLDEYYSDLDKVLLRAEECRKSKKAISIGYLGNVVDLWEKIVKENFEVDLASDQTSLHNPYAGGYYPQGLSLDKAKEMMVNNPEKFKEYVHKSLRYQVDLINEIVNRGAYFWDYGNSFLYMAGVAGADIYTPDGKFKHPSYVEDIMGPLCFDYGFGPFRWICTSASEEDLDKTDKIAQDVLETLYKEAPSEIKPQLKDNIMWIKQAKQNNLVVGIPARILYAHAEGRIKIALAFNKAIKDGIISAPIIIGRDHHDVSGTDSPYRETANIKDGSNFTADMSIQNVIGDAIRGASWVAIHNGGGVGWGLALNGGFGLVLDGSDISNKKIQEMLFFDVYHGITRRAWAGNPNALSSIKNAIKTYNIKITIPYLASKSTLEKAYNTYCQISKIYEKVVN